MRALVLFFLLVPGLAVSAAVSPPAAPEVVTPTSAGSGQALTHLQVRLKDGQQAKVVLRQYDDMVLSVSNALGTRFDLPWNEIAAIENDDAGPDLALMQGHLTAEPVVVSTALERRSPLKAFAQAMWPGVLLHGAGHRYAGDQDTFFSLAGGELFGLVVGGFGLAELVGPEKTGESKDTSLALAAAGGIIFGLTWHWDVVFAPGAAAKFNRDHGLVLEPRLNGAQLAYRF